MLLKFHYYICYILITKHAKNVQHDNIINVQELILNLKTFKALEFKLDFFK